MVNLARVQREGRARWAAMSPEEQRAWSEKCKEVTRQVDSLMLRSEWQPIETAPKEGIAPIWLAAPGRMRLGYWLQGRWADFARHEQHYADTVRLDLNFTPTHWMPLPEPPK
jgi:hypothetical protein